MKEIVLVDDDEVFLEIVKIYIEARKGFKCITFTNPEDALRYVLEEKGIHAVISDYEMPQMSGLTLAKTIDEQLPTVKLIVISGHETNYLRKQALKAGVNENKIQLLCKSDIVDLVVLLDN